MAKPLQDRYEAFISYSHAAQGELAPQLQRALERYAKRWYQIRSIRVFRDQTNLSVRPDLWGEIQRALDRSRFFILLASPESAGSIWVRREIEHWLATKSADSILIVLTDGEIAWSRANAEFDWEGCSALSRALARKYKTEPYWIDLRWIREPSTQLSTRDPRFAHAVLALSATLHGKSMDEMGGEAVREQRRTIRLAWSAALSIAVLAVGAIVLAWLATLSAGEARRQEQAVHERESIRLAEAARAELARGNSVDAVHLSLSALPKVFAAKTGFGPWAGTGPDRPLVPEAVGALIEALAANRERLYVEPKTSSGERDRFIWADFARAETEIQALSRTGRFWRISALTGQVLSQVDGPSPRIEYGASNRDGRLVVTKDEAGKLLVWSSQRPSAARVLPVTIPAREGVQDLLLFALDDSSPRVVVVGGTGSIVIADPEANRIVASFSFSRGGSGSLLNLGKQHLLEVWDQGKPHYWDIASGTRVARPQGLPRESGDTATNEDGSVLLTFGVGAGGAVLWKKEPNDSEYRQRYTMELRSRESLALSPRGDHVAKIDRDGRAAITPTASRLRTVPLATRGRIDTFKFHRSGLRALALLEDGGLAAWAAPAEGWVPGMSITPAPGYRARFTPNGRNVVMSALRMGDGPGGKRLQGCLVSWQLPSRQVAQVFGVPGPGWVRGLAIAPAGDWAIGTTTDTLHIWSLADGRHLLEAGGDADPIEMATIAADGRSVWSANRNGILKLRSVPDMTAHMQVQIPAGALTGLALDPSGSHIALSYVDQPPVVLATRPPHGQRLIDGVAGRVWALSSGMRNGTFLAGTTDGSVHEIAAESGRVLRTFTGLSSEVAAIDAHPGTGQVSAVTYAGDIGIWHTAKNELWARLRYDLARLYSVSFSPAGDQIVISGHDGRAVLYDVAPDIAELTARARLVAATRPLSEATGLQFGVTRPQTLPKLKEPPF